MFNECASESYISNVSEQGFTPVPNVAPEAIIDIALLSNNSRYNDDGHYDSLIELNTHELAFVDFISCFYSQQGGHFSISSLNKHFKPLLLHHQNYKTTDNKNFIWNLNQQCLKAYSNKYNVSENNISAVKKIELTKEVFGNQSLATNTGFQTTLAWDQVINNLVTDGEIVYTGDNDHSAKVVFRIFYVFYSKALDIKVASIFRYKTDIPCYRNLYNNPDHYIPHPYSKLEDCKKISENRKTEKEEPKTKLNSSYFENDDDNTTIASLMTRQLISAFKDGEDEDEDEEDEDDFDR